MTDTGNVLALFVLMAWPLLAVLAFRRYAPAQACALVMLGGVLLLPAVAHVRIPGLAAFSKETVPPLWAFIGLALAHPRHVARHLPFRGVEALFLLVFVGAVGTAFTNADSLGYGPRRIQGIGLYETLHVLQYDVLTLFIPFYVGRLCHRTPADLQRLLAAIAVGALLYAPLILLESRMSPQLHGWVYGVRPISDFSQTMRGGGWRPNVFFSHGLALAVFMASALVAAAPFARNRWPLHRIRRSRAAFAALAGLLFICRSAGGLVYGAVGAMLAWLGSSRSLLRVATLLVALVLVYPFLRTWGLFPDGPLVAVSEQLAGFERASSLEFRFENEKALMAKTIERPVFGWGPYGRAVVYDRDTGDELAVRDGAWIILLGERGIFGFVAAFGLLVLPVVTAMRRLRYRQETPLRRLGATLAFVVALNAVDLLPNGLFNYLPFFFAGALAGLNESAFLRRRVSVPAESRATAGSPRPLPRRPAHAQAS
jgi:hypothetical protein